MPCGSAFLYIVLPMPYPITFHAAMADSSFCTLYYSDLSHAMQQWGVCTFVPITFHAAMADSSPYIVQFRLIAFHVPVHYCTLYCWCTVTFHVAMADSSFCTLYYLDLSHAMWQGIFVRCTTNALPYHISCCHGWFVCLYILLLRLITCHVAVHFCTLYY